MPAPFIIVGGAVLGGMYAAKLVRNAVSAVFFVTREMKSQETKRLAEVQKRSLDLDLNVSRAEFQQSVQKKMLEAGVGGGTVDEGLVYYRLDMQDLPEKLHWLAGEFFATEEEMRQHLDAVRHLELKYGVGSSGEKLRHLCESCGVDYSSTKFLWDGVHFDFRWHAERSRRRLKDPELRRQLQEAGQIH
jgi:hypothetical protein